MNFNSKGLFALTLCLICYIYYLINYFDSDPWGLCFLSMMTQLWMLK